MTTATRRGTLALLIGAATFFLLALPHAGRAVTLDDRGEMRFGLRAYTAARIGTERTGAAGDPLSFPDSSAGHLRQNRFFLELKLDHDLTRLANTGRGGLSRLLGWFHPNVLKYSVQYRGEGEGIYDYGPSEFTNSFHAQKLAHIDLPDLNAGTIHLSSHPPDGYIRPRVDRLMRIARQKHRFFLGYLDLEKGPAEIRIGRQILAWGETDVFRLLDNINPIDNGFGGFLIALDERRVPLDMLRGSYHFGSVGPFSDTTLEAFGALGNRVSTVPGIPPGSPWIPGGLGYPNPALHPVGVTHRASDFRGGARLGFTVGDVTATIAHYYTYLDTPAVVFRVPKGFPGFPNSIDAVQKVPRIPITGASMTFPVPSWYSVVRSEVAYFQGEPLNRQGRGNSADASAAPGTPGYARLKSQNNTEGGLDPFVYPGFLNLLGSTARTTGINGQMLQRNTFNWAAGLDVNRFVRWLNPGQTIFITTQMFIKHVFDSPGDLALPVVARNIEVAGSLPLIGYNKKTNPAFGCGGVNGEPKRSCRLEPRLIHLNDNQILHTILITTSYQGGRIVPSLGAFYDWQGAFVAQPGVALLRDPFRFIFDYTWLGSPLGAGTLSALRDRDNVRFQMEYVF
jgi:hypothetical protein